MGNKSIALFYLVSATAVVLSQWAAAQDMTVFGLRMGARISVPYCDIGRFPAIPETCYTTGYDGSPIPGELTGRLFLTNEQRVRNWNDGFSGAPSIVLIDGSLEAVTMATRGDDASQQLLLKRLTAKYGKPRHVERQRLQNLMGAQFAGIAAVWNFPSLRVEYTGRTTVNEGSIELTTERYRMLHAANTETRRRRTQPF